MVLREEVTSMNMVGTRLAFIRYRYDRGEVKVRMHELHTIMIKIRPIVSDYDTFLARRANEKNKGMSNLLSGTLNTLRGLYVFND